MKPLTAIIVHGCGSNPERNWFPWLRSELRSRGVSTIAPRFPTPDGHNLDTWREIFRNEVGEISASHILVGHSAGVPLLINALNAAPTAAFASFFAAGFFGSINHRVYDPHLATFFVPSIDWTRVRRNAGRLFLYASDSDPTVPAARRDELARQLNSHVEIIPGGGHLNDKSGFTSFPKLLADIDRCLATAQSD